MKTSEDVHEGGLYASACCSVEVIVAKGATFTRCPPNLKSGMAPCRDALQKRAAILRKNLDWHARLAFEEAVVAIENFISVPPPADARGMPIFARGGASPFLQEGKGAGREEAPQGLGR